VEELVDHDADDSIYADGIPGDLSSGHRMWIYEFEDHMGLFAVYSLPFLYVRTILCSVLQETQESEKALSRTIK
jgi:hypothetical protein